MSKGRVILSPKVFNITLRRLAHQLIENFDDFSNTSIIGIQEKGVTLAENLIHILQDKFKNGELEFGKLDISFYRDDYRLRDTPIKVSPTDIDFSLEGKKVILIDDVLYSGRTIQAALSAIQDFGRPMSVDVLVLVDRRFNRSLPIQPNFSGVVVDALDEAYVRVKWDEKGEDHKVFIYSPEITN